MLKYVVVAITLFCSLYCLRTKSYKRGLLLFFVYTSCVEGPLKMMTWGKEVKILVYIIRDLMLYILLARAILSNYFEKERRLQELPKPPYAGLALFYLAWCAILVFNPRGYNLLNSIAGLRFHVEMIPLFFFGYYLMSSKRDYKILFYTVIICAVLNSAVSLMQVVKGPEWTVSIHPGYVSWAKDAGRIFLLRNRVVAIRPPGLGPDMGFAGHYAIYAFPMILVLFNSLKNKAMPRMLLAGSFILLVLGIYSSFARSAYVLTFIIIFLSFYVFNTSRNIRRKMQLVTAVLIFLAIGSYVVYQKWPFLTERLETVKTIGRIIETITERERGRLNQITVLVAKMAWAYPFGDGLGKVGPGARIFAKDSEPSFLNSENQMTLGMAETGVPGVLLLFLFHIRVFLFGKKWYRRMRGTEMDSYAAVPLVIIILMFVLWPFGNLTSFPANVYFWFCAGVLCRFKAYVQKENGADKNSNSENG